MVPIADGVTQSLQLYRAILSHRPFQLLILISELAVQLLLLVLQQIIDFNNKVRACLDNGVKIEHGSGLIELWDFLQVSTAFMHHTPPQHFDAI